MVITRRLKARMVEKGFTQTTLAEATGLNIGSLNYKLNGKQEFWLSEWKKLCAVLEIADDTDYFGAE